MSAPGPRPRGAEEGSATVEFIGWTVGVVVPVLYLIVALAQIQAASFAVASAADAAARVLAVDAGPGALAHAAKRKASNWAKKILPGATRFPPSPSNGTKADKSFQRCLTPV